MLAALLTALNTPLVLAEIEPTELTFGQVLVKVLVAGICGAQLAEIRGDKNPEAPLPRLMGHEACVRVEAVGPGVSLRPGQKCCLHWRLGSGIESDFPRYRYGSRQITSGKVTCFSEVAIVSENRLTAVAEETPNELVALLGCGLSTALGTIEKEANLLMGENILIVGCGGLGLNLIRAARMRRAGFIVGKDHLVKSGAAFQAGASQFYGPGSLCEYGDKFDVIVDTSGNAEAIADALPLLAPSGRMIMVGQPGPKQGIMLHNARHMFDGSGKSIKATQGGGFMPQFDLPRYVGLWRSGQLSLDGIITHRVSLSEINQAIDVVRDGAAGRVLIEMV